MASWTKISKKTDGDFGGWGSMGWGNTPWGGLSGSMWTKITKPTNVWSKISKPSNSWTKITKAT